MANAQDSNELVVGGNGDVYVADLGATIPTGLATPGVGWTKLGYTTDDGVKFTDNKTITPITSWQSMYPTRRIITAREGMVEFTLQQWNKDTVSLAFGGGTFTLSAGVTTYTPPDPADVDERMLLIDVADGTESYRFIIERGMVTNNVESSFVRTGAALLPIQFGINGVGSGSQPWSFRTNAAVFASGTSS